MKTLGPSSRPIRVLLCAAGSCGLLSGVATIRAQGSDMNVSGNLTVVHDAGVGGILDVNGNTFNFGTWTGGNTYGLNITYSEDASHASTLTLGNTRPVSGWLWQKAKPNNAVGSLPQMRLSAGNVLSLYNQATPTPSATIVLDPVNVSTFGASVYFYGTDNQMPGQTATSNNSVLTVGLANQMYFNPQASREVALGTDSWAPGDAAVSVGSGSTASGSSSVALGWNSIAQGYGSVSAGAQCYAYDDSSVALGTFSSAGGISSMAAGVYTSTSGYSAVAIGAASSAANDAAVALGEYSAASGWASISLGYQSSAMGISSVALGNYSSANGSCSTALTNSAAANGDFSVAAGRTTAAAFCQTVVGTYNVAGGNATSWVPTDDLFTVGNGQSANTPSNALSVKKNGDMTVSGNLQVVKAILVQPQGDLSMGEFTAQPSPTP